MFVPLVTAVLAAAGTATAGPIQKRADINDGKSCDGSPIFPHLLSSSLTVGLGVILNYALTLEHLEDTFYRGGLANFTEAEFAAAGFDSTFYTNLQHVGSDETEHVSFLTKALQGMVSSRNSQL